MIARFDASPLQPVFWTGPLSLAPGESKGIDLLDVPGQLPYGTFTWTAVIDPGNLVPEPNESNNVDTHEISTVQAALPDLTITRVETDPDHPVHLQLYEFAVTVRNVGVGPLHIGSFPPAIEVDAGCDAYFPDPPTLYTSRLDPGQDVVLRVDARPGLAMQGWHECTFRVVSSYQDTGGNNNDFEHRWYVNPSR